MYKYVKKIIDYHVIPVIMLVVLFFNKFMPLLVISKYNHSNADDFWMSSGAHFVWEDTHSFFKTVSQAFKNAVLIWENWDGCFLSMFVGGLPPVVFHEDYYKYTFAVLAGALIVCTAAMLYELLVRLLKFPFVHYVMIGLAMLIMFFNFLPSAKDGYYWWVGGINYTLFTSVLLLSQAFLIEYIVSGRKFFLGAGAVFAFATGLGNLLSGLINPLILILEFAVLLCTDKIKRLQCSLKLNKKEKILYVIPVLCGLAGLMCNVLAPGNLIRGGEGLFNNPVLLTIWKAITASAAFIPHFYRKPMIWFFIFITVVILDAMRRKKTDFLFPYPLIFIVLSFGVYCAVFAPVIYAGSAFYGRCKNVSFYAMMFMYLFDIIYVAGWIFAKFKISMKDAVSKGLVYISLILLLVFSKADELYFDCAGAQDSLRTGQAQDFDRKVDERFSIYYDKSITKVEVEEITWIPPIFYWDEDCLADLAHYFQKDYIKLIKVVE